jgi:DNA-binding NtrC family response regulator
MTLSRINILIVDNDASFRTGVQRVVEQAGYTAEVLPSGSAALERLDRADDVPGISAVHAVLLDVAMSGLDGIDTLCRIKARRPRLPVIMISDREQTGSVVEVLRAGAIDFLDRPLDPDRLFVALRNALRTGRLEEQIHALETRSGSPVPGPPKTEPEPWPDQILPAQEEERRYIDRALQITGGNIMEAAHALQISRATLYRKIQKYGLRRPTR